MKNREDSFFEEFKKQIQDAIKDLKTSGKRHRQIPNILTLTRLTAPCFIIPAAIFGNVPMILGMVAFFSLTDLADGLIARNFNLTSELGKTLDTIADKIFASTLLLATSFTQPFLLCNLVLEGVIAGINSYKKINNQLVSSSTMGKLKTWFLFSLVGVGIASSYFDLNSILNVLMVSTTVMQVLTIHSYLPIGTNDKKSISNGLTDNNYSNNLNGNDLKLKDKVLEKDKNNEQEESLNKLKEIRDVLVSEKSFLEDDTKKIDSNNYCKNKKDDFKKD